MTDALYYDDPMARAFDATVVGLEDDGLTAVLAATLFYPEGGGQPADHGTIGGIRVVDVQKGSDGAIRHSLASPLEVDPDAIGSAVLPAVVDWDRRWDYMQQHTGQHVLSGALARVAGAATVSVHQGADVTTIEIDAEALDDATLARVEDDANRVIRDDRPVRGFWIDDAELPHYDLRRPTGRTGAIRLVEIVDYDLVACGGVHLPRTGMLNLVHLTTVERIRGHLRLAFTIGDRAIRDYRDRDRIVREAATRFSAHPDELVSRVVTTIEEVQNLRGELRRRATELAAEILGAHTGPTLLIRKSDMELFAALAQRAADTDAAPLCIVHPAPEGLHWAVIFDPRTITADRLRNELLVPFDAKGGGKPPLWRGIIKDAGTDTPARFLARFEEVVGGS
jgi:alanyl-tRNA synthetase